MQHFLSIACYLYFTQGAASQMTATTTTRRPPVVVKAPPSPLESIAPVEPIVNYSHEVNTALGMFADNIQGLLIVGCLTLVGFLVCLIGRYIYRRRALQDEIHKYMDIVPKYTPTTMAMTSTTMSSRAGLINPKPGPYDHPTLNLTSMVNQLHFTSAQYSTMPNWRGQMQQQQPFVPESSGMGNRDPDEVTIVDDDGAVLAIPGYLQMDFKRDLRLKNKIAEGGGGVVYKGDLLNKEIEERLGFSDIVIKVVKPMANMPFAELQALVNQEIAVMQLLHHHPNCIKIAGYTDEPLSIVLKRYDRSLFHLVLAPARYTSDSAEYDALKSYIKADTKLKKGLLVKGFELLPEIALHLAWGMANGMAEMHRLGILHRDLKSANVLLEYRPAHGDGTDQPAWMRDPALSSMIQKVSGILGQSSLAGGLGWGKDPRGRPFCPVNPVICDFGLAKMIKKRELNMETPTGVKGMRETVAVGISYRYAAPEAFNRMKQKPGRDFEEKRPVDVFAFGVMCWEMLERKVPFHKLSNAEVEERVKKGDRPPISPQYRNVEKLPNNNKHYLLLVKMIEACWKQNPLERPSFDEVRNKIRRFWLGLA